MNSGFVSIVGRPNVGKSTLLNRIVGEKIAAVSPKPQTTRNRLLGVRNYKEGKGGQIVFIDTPGIHKPHTKMHRKMVEVALAALQGIDLILLMVDASAEFGAGDGFVLEALKGTGVPVTVALNKVDLVNKSRILPLIELYNKELPSSTIVPISALNGDGIEALERELLAALPEGKPIFAEDVLTDQPERSLAAEIVREKVFLFTHREVPYSSAVFIDAWEEFEDLDRIDIAATILLDRASQKGIVIGRGGAMLKKIGTAARVELEQLLNAKIYLELWVKVREGWRENDTILRDLGLE
jgi:GTP-binding protein Era